ncbi:MAG: hypothetical protein Q9181_005396 [Wetmoreana brouardii]
MSERLAQSKLYVILILSGNEPFCIPAWPISSSAQFKVIRIFRKACELFPTTPEWVTRLASRTADWNALDRLEARASDTYLIRRTLIQHEIIFSGEGLTLLNVDHIYTFKKRLLRLSETSPLDRDHERLMESCVHILRRINATYRGIKLSKSYLERAYGMGLSESTLKEVCQAYLHEFSEPGVQGMNVKAGCEVPQLPELESPTDGRPADNFHAPDTMTAVAELSAFMQHLDNTFDEADAADARSPCNDVDSGFVEYPKVPTPTCPPYTPSPVPPPARLDSLTTTICSRCLANIETQAVSCGQEMTTLMSPEWENFRRIGLGISRC